MNLDWTIDRVWQYPDKRGRAVTIAVRMGDRERQFDIPESSPFGTELMEHLG